MIFPRLMKIDQSPNKRHSQLATKTKNRFESHTHTHTKRICGAKETALMQFGRDVVVANDRLISPLLSRVAQLFDKSLFHSSFDD